MRGQTAQDLNGENLVEQLAPDLGACALQALCLARKMWYFFLQGQALRNATRH
jgi:hypothetical protein